jgi:hypothetical protein
MIAQHELLGIRMQVDLLVYPLRRWVAVQGRAMRARLGRSRVRLLQLPADGIQFYFEGPCR